MASMPDIPKISLSRNQIIMICVAVALIGGVFVLLKFFGSKAPSGPPVALTVWGSDAPDAMKGIVAGYSALRPNVTVTYTQLPGSNYNEALINGLASGRGPDLFMIGNHDAIARSAIMAPAPAAQASPETIQGVFPQAVAQDFFRSGMVQAMPLYMDTLVLLYNRQMFDQAGIATPPTTWQELLDIVSRLRVVDSSGQISRAAIAMGGSEDSVVHATDILNLIMIQNGVVMSDENGKPSFSGNSAAVAALRFYMQFADAGNPAYTWNDFMGRSLESFASQKSAMAFAYQSDLAALEKQSPFLDYGVTSVPQISTAGAVNYPKYQGLAVWTGSRQQAWAWDFAIFASTNSSAQESYLSFTGRPAALRQIITAQQNNPDLGPFSRASLTARSWKMGDYDKIKTIFSTAIKNVQTGAKTETQALADAEAQANQLILR